MRKKDEEKQEVAMKITASIVTFNSVDEIEQLLASLLKCNLEAANIYVVDNGSSDGTAEIEIGRAHV